MEATTYQEVQGLSRMTVGELRGKYLDVFGEETRSYHKEFLQGTDLGTACDVVFLISQRKNRPEQ